MFFSIADKQARAVAIIGSADGPTAIYVAYGAQWMLLAAGVLVVAIVVAAIVWYKKRKGKK